MSLCSFKLIIFKFCQSEQINLSFNLSIIQKDINNKVMKPSKLATIGVLFFVFLYLFFKCEFSQANQSIKISEQPKWNHKGCSKIILIIVDALRADYVSKIPFFKKMITANPQNSKLLQIKTGSPTMTTQRIEAMMTGSQIFSPLNILDNFLSQQVSIDNIITQLSKNNKKSIVFGDDTWTKLFNFTDSKVCDSTFNIKDYETCDNLIYQFLPDSVQKNEFQFVVGHFLAIDHIGHATSSIEDQAIPVKLEMISTFLNTIADKMPEDSIILVTGDHGMRKDGNHGGLTDEEVNTVLFAHYKSQSRMLPSKTNSLPYYQQIDLAATLSVLLSLPIPANSIGFPIIQILPASIYSQDIKNNFLKSYTQILELTNASKEDKPTQIYEKYYNSTQQLIINEVRDKYLMSLSKGSSSPISIIAVLSVMIIISCYFFYSAFKGHLKRILQLKNTFFQDVAQIGFSLVVFTVSFSWLLLRHYSTIITLVCVGLIVISAGCKKIYPDHDDLNIFKVLLGLIIIFVLCQVQPSKINEYQVGVFRIQKIASFFSADYTLVAINGLAFMIYFRTLFRTRRFKRVKPKSLFKTDTKDTVLKCIIALLNLIDQAFLPNQKIFSCFIRIINIAIMFFWLFKLFLDRNKVNINRIQILQFITANFFFIFIGKYAIFIVFSIYFLSKLFNNQSTNSVFMYLMGELGWWMLGNRYEYSSIDIKRSYIFSEEFNIFLNGFSMIVYLLSPYILCFLLNSLMHVEKYYSIVYVLRPKISPMRLQKIQEQQRLKEIDPVQKMEIKMEEDVKIRDEFIQWVKTQNIKYFIAIMLTTLSCCINLFVNEQKILFTVVYIPLLIFTTFKCFFMFILIKIYQTLLIQLFSSKFIPKQRLH